MSASTAMGDGARKSFTLSSGIRLKILYRDTTLLGGDVSSVAEACLTARFSVLRRYRQRYGVRQLVREGHAILERVLPHCLDGIRLAPDRLHESWLYPDPACITPAYLRVERDIDSVVARISVRPSLWPDLAGYLGEWQRGAAPPQAEDARELWEALLEVSALVEAGPLPAPPGPGITFVGHATIRIADLKSAILIDPFVQPTSTLLPDDWQPLGAADLAPVDAILITHSHPDHYDPGTLLRLGAETPIYVPAVARESILTVGMAARLRELGFREVHEISPWNEWRIGSLRVVALPFHGEQPSVSEVLHPEVRNQGLTYMVECEGRWIAAIADAGTDWSGNAGSTAIEARRRYGPIDTLFGGHRGFGLYPIQFAFSSVARYLPFIPPSLWGVRQQIMCDDDDLIDVGELWGAKRIVPYAAGGAPWFWLRGLGARLDQDPGASVSTEPRPEDLCKAALRRGFSSVECAASPVEIRVLRAGETL